LQWIVETLRRNPELAVFLTLAFGFLVARLKLGTFTLGPVLGTLLAGVLIGQLNIVVPATVKVLFFDFFLFATGYKVGPQFFRGLRRDAFPQLVLTVVVCVASLLTAVGISRLLGYDTGTAAGLLAGAFTESTVIGTASEAIRGLGLADAEKARLLNNIPVAYAVTYLVGTTTVVWFLSWLAPRLLRIDLPEASRRLELELSGKAQHRAGVRSAYQAWNVRAFRVTGAEWVGKTVAQIEHSVAGARVFVERVRHGTLLLKPEPHMTVQEGDCVALVARRSVFLTPMAGIGPEIDDPELLDFPLATLDAVVTRREVAGKTLSALGELHGAGVILRRLTRGGQEMPFEAGTVVQRGDLLELTGHDDDIERAGRALGYLDRSEPATDVIFLSFGIVLGGFLGLLSVRFGKVAIELTTSGGALVMGLVFGWLRSIRPVSGRIPEAALWVFDNLGLTVFIGIVGLGAGPSFVSGLRETGPTLLLSGLLVALIPQALGLLLGRFVLRMNPVVLLGALTGAGTTTAGLKAVQDAAQSKLPVLGYTVPYALGNILLTAWGPVIVAIMS
jgi:putative transport protein